MKVSARIIKRPAGAQAADGQSRLRHYPLIRSSWSLLSPPLRSFVSIRTAALPQNLAREVLGHLEGAIRTAKGLKSITAGTGSSSVTPNLRFLNDGSARANHLIERVRENKLVLAEVQPQFDELLAFLHDIGKFEADASSSSPFWGHSPKGYEILTKLSSSADFEIAGSTIAGEDLALLVRLITRFHIAISNYCSGERSARTLLQMLNNSFLAPFLKRPDFRRLFLAALLDVTLSDVGAYGNLSLFKIECYLDVYDHLNNYYDSESGSLAQMPGSPWRINQLLAMEDREIDRRTAADPYYYYHQFETLALRQVDAAGLDGLLFGLTKIDKLVYFRRLWLSLVLRHAGVDFLRELVAAVEQRFPGAQPETLVMAELPQIRGRATIKEAVNVLGRPAKISQLFNPVLGHLAWDEYRDNFDTPSARLRIGLPDFLLRCRTVGLPASTAHRVLWRAAFESAGFVVIDTPFESWPAQKRKGLAVVPSETACLTSQVAVGSFFDLQAQGAGAIVKPIENDGEHPVCFPDRGYAHAVAIPAYFPEIYTPDLQQSGWRTFRRSPLGQTLVELGASTKQLRSFQETFAGTPIPAIPRPFSPEALGRPKATKILLVGREKNLHPRNRGKDNLLDWLVAEYPDITIVTPGMYPLKSLGLKKLKLTAPYEWKVEVLAPIIAHLIKTGEIQGIIFCQTESCRPAHSGISFLENQLAGLLKETKLPYLKLTPSQARSQVLTRLRAFMESINTETRWLAKALDPLSQAGQPETFFMGIDVGSTTIKVTIIDSKLNVRSSLVKYKSKPSVLDDLKETVAQALAVASLPPAEISRIVACGSGSVGLKKTGLADALITEISAHGLGAYCSFREPLVVLDIGGEDTKVVFVDQNGRVENFLMNTRCSAGTGKSLVRIAGIMNQPLQEIDRLAALVSKGEDISGSCALHIESGVTSCVSFAGPEVSELTAGEIAHGAFRAFTRNMSRLFPALAGLKSKIVLTGGGSLLASLVSAVNETFGVETVVPSNPQATASLGAAIYAKANFLKSRDT